MTTSDKPFHSLLRTENYEGSGAKEEATHVGGYVIDGDDGHGEDVPDHAVTQGQVHQIPSSNQIPGGQMRPGWKYKILELFLQHKSSHLTQQGVSGQTLVRVPHADHKPRDQTEVDQETQTLSLSIGDGQIASYTGVNVVQVSCVTKIQPKLYNQR